MNEQPDKYELAIRHLVLEHPREIYAAWVTPESGPAGWLFQFVNPSGSLFERRPDGKECGCPTLIRSDPSLHAWTDELTTEIRADTRIPDNVVDMVAVCKKDRSLIRTFLEPFAEWQRRLDREIRGVTP